MMNKYNIEVKLVSGTDYCVEVAPIEIMAEHKTDVYEKIKQGFEAVERMKPKKPNKCTMFSQSLFICPYCGRKQAIMYEQYHCKECGQKIDWSE